MKKHTPSASLAGMACPSCGKGYLVYDPETRSNKCPACGKTRWTDSEFKRQQATVKPGLTHSERKAFKIKRATAEGVRFADRLNEVMRVKGISVEQLVALLSATDLSFACYQSWQQHKTVTEYTTGEAWPQRRTIHKLAAALGVSFEALNPGPRKRTYRRGRK